MERFEYLEPGTLEEVSSILATHGEDARVMAGGQSLIVMMVQRLLTPGRVVSLAGVPGLDLIEETDGEVSIGAMATHRSVAADPIIKERLGLLAQAVGSIGSPAVRNLGTLGGDLCMNEVGADPPQALLSLGARVRITGRNGERVIGLEDFFTGYLATCLEPDDLLTHILIPTPPERLHQIYIKHSARVLDRALVGVALALELDGGDGVCTDVRIGLGGVAPTPFRAVNAEEIILGNPLTDDIIAKAGKAASEHARPLSDVHGSADYRRKMVEVFVKRALLQVLVKA